MNEPLWAEIKVPVLESGEELLETLIRELGIWGGVAYSDGRTEDLQVTVECNPQTALGGPSSIIEWLARRGVEYSVTFSWWPKD